MNNNILCKRLLVIVMVVLSMAMTAQAQNLTWSFDPGYQEYTQCVSGTVNHADILYTSCLNYQNSRTYQRGQIKAAIWAYNHAAHTITIRVAKCSGNFQNGNTFKIFVRVNGTDFLECQEFTINNSYTSYKDVVMDIPWTDFSGTKTMKVYLITSDNEYYQYAGELSVTYSQSGSGDDPTCYCLPQTYLTASSGTFEDGSGAGNYYANNTDCQWHINVPNANSITLTFSRFQTEYNFDSLAIYQGNSTSAPLITTLTGQPSLSPIIVPGSSVTLHFLTDGSVNNYTGWELSYTANNSGSGCAWSDCSSGNCGTLDQIAFEAASYLCSHNVVDNGSPTSPTLNPDAYVTRAQLAKMAFFALYDGEANVPGTLVTDYLPSIYPDLQDQTAYYYRAAKALLYLQWNNDANGITPFDRNRAIFNPTGTISRKMVLKVLLETFNIAPSTSSSNPFDDFPSSEQAWGYAKKARELGITTNDHFRPNDLCTRAEAMVFLYRIMTTVSWSTPQYTGDIYTSDFFIPNNLKASTLASIKGVEYGNYKYYNKNCFKIDGWVSMDFGFSYNSYLTEMPADFYPIQPLGSPAWSHTYNLYMNIVADEYNNQEYLVFHLDEGSVVMYRKQGSTLEKLTDGDYNTVVASGLSAYTLTSPSQTVYTFTKLVSAQPIYYLTSITNRFGDAVSINYQTASMSNDYKRISTVSMGSGSYYQAMTFNYSGDKLSSVTDPLGRTVEFYYSGNKLHEYTDARNHTTTFNYGNHELDANLLTSVVMPEGNTVYNNYERNKLRSTRTGTSTAHATTIQHNINPQSNIYESVVTEPNTTSNQNVITHYVMNEHGKVTHVYDNCNVDITYHYANSTHTTLPSSVVNNKTGVTTSYTYTLAGKVGTITEAAGGLTRTETYDYNSYNDLISYTDANNHTTTYSYVNNGHLRSITDASGRTTQYNTNSHGYVTSMTTPSGVVTEYDYTPRGMLHEVSVAGRSITYTYDAAGRMHNLTDQNSHTTTYTYDENDNVTSVQDANGHTTSFLYDDNDNLTRVTNARGYYTTLTYDDNDLVTSQSFQGSTKSFTYYNDGSLHTIATPRGDVLTFTYNTSGDLTADGYATYSYRTDSRLGNVTKDGKAITYGYDAFGRVTSVAYDGKTVGYTYDLVGNIQSITYPGNRTVNYSYDNANRMTSVTDWNNHTTTYNYRADGQLNYLQYPNGVRTTYSYESSTGRRNGQTTRRNDNTIIASYSYTLDDVGNHISETVTEPFTTMPQMSSASVAYVYGNDNRLQLAGTDIFGYDNNGNTTQKGSRSMSYDPCNNLTSVNGDLSATFEYDGLGNRRKAVRNGVTTKYVLDILAENANVLMETNASGTAQCYYIYGADGLVSRIGAGGSTTHYYVYDHRGSTVAMVDGTTAATVTHKYQYDDFGKVLQMQEADDNSFRFVGKYGLMYEAEDLYFVRARYYDPTIGRFLSEDPIWSTNLYQYSNNNPIINVDISGAVPVRSTSDFSTTMNWKPQVQVNTEKSVQNIGKSIASYDRKQVAVEFAAGGFVVGAFLGALHFSPAGPLGIVAGAIGGGILGAGIGYSYGMSFGPLTLVLVDKIVGTIKWQINQ